MAAIRATQRGKFFHGTSGYPVRIQLGISLADASSITILLTPPNNGTPLTRSIPLQNILDSAAGTFDYIPQTGDLLVAGAYTLRITVVSTGGRVLTTEAAFAVA